MDILLYQDSQNHSRDVARKREYQVIAAALELQTIRGYIPKPSPPPNVPARERGLDEVQPIFKVPEREDAYPLKPSGVALFLMLLFLVGLVTFLFVACILVGASRA